MSETIKALRRFGMSATADQTDRPPIKQRIRNHRPALQARAVATKNSITLPYVRFLDLPRYPWERP